MIKATAYGAYRRNTAETYYLNSTAAATTGTSETLWLGGTFDYEKLQPLGIQATFIGNWGKTRLDGDLTDSYLAYLADFKITYAWEAPQINFTLEGLLTPGASDAVDAASGANIEGKRAAFSSPINTSYLLTLATSDGVDESPGTSKQSVIGGLGQSDGLRLLIFTTSFNMTKRMTTFVRYGNLSSSAASSTGSKAMGNEFDLGTVYQLTPSTSLQMDYGYLIPGAYYANKESASIFATRMKVSF